MNEEEFQNLIFYKSYKFLNKWSYENKTYNFVSFIICIENRFCRNQKKKKYTTVKLPLVHSIPEEIYEPRKSLKSIGFLPIKM